MSLFEHEARQFKFDVMREVSKRAFNGKLSVDTIDEIANLLIPTKKAEFRCCVYKEKEIIRQRTRMAMGKAPVPKENDNPRQIVRVIEAACDGCSIHKILVTDNCRKCMAKSCVSSCKFDAMKMGSDHAYIDYDKCKECGACANACPFNAIVVTQRPCKKSCPVDAISYDEGLLGAKLLGEAVGVVVHLLDDCHDPFPRLGQDVWAVIENAGHGGRGYACCFCYILNRRHLLRLL